MEEQVLKNKQDIAYHYEIDRTLSNFGIKVIGVLANVSELPVPYTGDYGDAYAVGNPGDYTYYIWTRANPDLGEPAPFWLDAGKLAIDTDLGTIVTVDGQKQTTWNADTKLDKVVVSEGKGVYAFLGNGTQGTCSVSTNNYTCYPNTGINTSGAVAGYVQTNWGAEKPNGDGVLLSNDPVQPYHVATKNYVDTTTANKNTPDGSGVFKVFCVNTNNELRQWYIGGRNGAQFSKNSIACYYDKAQGLSDVPQQEKTAEQMTLYTGTPVRDLQAANKKYVDTKTALYKTTIIIQPDPDTQYRIFANTHKAIDTTDSTFGELCELLTLPEDVAENPYNGVQNFVFGHIIINGTLQFIVDAQYAVNSDTINILYSIGSQINTVQIDLYSDCTAMSVKV